MKKILLILTLGLTVLSCQKEDIQPNTVVEIVEPKIMKYGTFHFTTTYYSAKVNGQSVHTSNDSGLDIYFTIPLYVGDTVKIDYNSAWMYGSLKINNQTVLTKGTYIVK